MKHLLTETDHSHQNNKLYYCIATYNRPDLLFDCVSAVYKDRNLLEGIIIIDNSKEGYAADILKDLDIILVRDSAINGLCGAWNYIFYHFNGDYIFSNDDIIVHDGCIQNAINAIEGNDNLLYFGYKDAFSWFILKRKAFLEVGYFDMNFAPIYFDDNDYAYRLKLIGVEPVVLYQCTFDHLHGGSASLKAYSPAEMEDHHRRFNKNKDYYISKWGGIPTEEKYTVPFNG